MKISVLLNAHNHTELVADTIESIKKYVTNDILMVVDGIAWEDWGLKVNLGVDKLQGFIHNYPKAPYRNLLYGLSEIIKKFPDSDWVCYSEYDVLFLNSLFKEELKNAENNNIWCLGNDLRNMNIQMPYLNKILNIEIKKYKYLLGCCVFLSKKFINKLLEFDFFNKILTATNHFEKGYFPDYEEQNGYDFGEMLIPTMADYFGGKVSGFAYWHQHLEQWQGNWKKFAMRWKPEIRLDEICQETSIIHPIKSKDLRKFLKSKRDKDVRIQIHSNNYKLRKPIKYFGIPKKHIRTI